MNVKASIYYGDNLLRPDLIAETKKRKFDCKSIFD